MHMILAGLLPLAGAVVASLDIDGFLVGNTFLSAVATFISTIIVQLFTVLFFGGSATL